MARRFYKVERGDNLADPDYWNKKLADIDLRLAAREEDGVRLEGAIEEMITAALTRLNDTFTPLITGAQNRLNTLGASFAAESLDEMTVASSGSLVVVLTEATAANYVYTDYVALRAAVAPENQMLAQVTSFDRGARELSITVIGSQGSGTFTDWLLRVGTPPETGHAARTDNPHEVTAAQVGAYTAALTDAAIAAAIALIPGVDLSSRLERAQNLADLLDKGAARAALGLGALATASSVGSGDFASNVRSTQAQAEAGTDATTLMSPLRTKQAIAANAPGAASMIGFQVITGSQGVTIPAGATKARVRMQGPGGGACHYLTSGGIREGWQIQYPSPGGAGGYLEKFLTGLTPGLTLTATIGARGLPASQPGVDNSTSGGTTTLSSGTQAIATLTANGGGRGALTAIGAGGSASGGDLNCAGGKGGYLLADYDYSSGLFYRVGIGGAATMGACGADGSVGSGYGFGGGVYLAGPFYQAIQTPIAGGYSAMIIEWFA